MRVMQAQSAGFCYGVERAVRMAEEAAAAGGCVMLGSIIHNDSVVRRLEALGAKYAEYDEAALEVPAEQIGTLVSEALQGLVREVLKFDGEELARLLNISDNQLSYITNVDSGRGLIKCGSAIVPFVDHFPKNKLYRLMTTKPSDLAA